MMRNVEVQYGLLLDLTQERKFRTWPSRVAASRFFSLLRVACFLLRSNSSLHLKDSPSVPL
jgi:hypothetical protein